MTAPPRRWTITPDPPPDSSGLRELASLGPEIGPLGARLLYNRGLRTAADARRYLAPEASHLADPFRLPDMARAVQRVARAIANGEKIGVHGDFDVDGLTGTALLLHTISDLGGVATGHIPRRDAAGHGLGSDAIAALHAQGVSLVITVDTGSTDGDEITRAGQLGIDVVVTDHHRAESPPAGAWAVVNPQLGGSPEDRDLTGAGVAFKLSQAIYDGAGVSPTSQGGWPPHIIALAALGTVADSGPLTADNRVIVSLGLGHLARTEHPGLAALLAAASPGSGDGPLDTESLRFGLVPRLNAPGRLGDASISLDLLTATDPAEALAIARQVEALNTERRRLSREAWEVAARQLAGEPELPALIVVRSASFIPGVLGPLAGRLCDEYGRPAVAIAVGDTTARASARSTPGFDLHAALQPCAGDFEQWGGHARAAGFTVKLERLDNTISALAERAAEAGGEVRVEPELVADAEVRLSDLPDAMWSFVSSLGPFGEGNPAPLFVTRGLTPSQVRTMGSGGDHLRLVLEDGGARRDAVGFRLGRAPLGGGLVDAAYTLRTNRWRGRTRRELGLTDIRPSEA